MSLLPFVLVPYMCGYGGLAAATTCLTTPALVNVAWLITEANSVAAAGNIDAMSNVRGRKVYIFHGTKDSTVRPGMKIVLALLVFFISFYRLH